MGRSKAHLGIIGFLLPVFAACAPAATAPRGAETIESTTNPGPTASSDAESGTPSPAADRLYPAPEAVPAPPVDCPKSGPLPVQTACDQAREDLAAALGLEGSARDSALSDLEDCSTFEPGLIRALRADLGPASCADVLVEPVVGDDADAVTELARDVKETLVGLGLAGRLTRLAGTPPQAPSARDKATLQSYFAEELFPWIERQAAAIYVLASQGKELHGYAKGLVAIEAGNADMRFVEIARQAPISDEIEKEPEARDLYYATLDERLEPRKARGSAAALVGMREMAAVGVRHSERVAAARALLSRAYGGRRVNALDTLLVPPLPAEKAQDAASAIASRVPSVYATALVGPAPLTPLLVRAHLQMGMPVALRRSIEAGDAGPESRFLLGRGLFEQGRTYFRAQDFQDAEAILSTLLDEEVTSDKDASSANALSQEQKQSAVFLRALCLALMAGPKDAAEMIARGPRFADALGNLVLLDALADSSGPQSGRAAFDAAYLRELVVAPADPGAWNDLAKRYEAAASLLTGQEATWAKKRAQACRDIEKAVRAEQANAKKQP